MKLTQQQMITAIERGDLATLNAIEEGTDVNFLVTLVNPPVKIPLIGLIGFQQELLLNKPGIALSVLEVLVEKGADINALVIGKPLLMHFVSNFMTFLAEKMLDIGADPNCVDAQGIPALLLALCVRNEEMRDTLILHGADPSVRDQYGCNLLHKLSSLTPPTQGSWDFVVEPLLALDVDIHAVANNGMNPVTCAQYLKRDSLVAILTEAGAVVQDSLSPEILNSLTQFVFSPFESQDKERFSQFCTALKTNESLRVVDLSFMNLDIAMLEHFHLAMQFNPRLTRVIFSFGQRNDPELSDLVLAIEDLAARTETSIPVRASEFEQTFLVSMNSAGVDTSSQATSSHSSLGA